MAFASLEELYSQSADGSTPAKSMPVDEKPAPADIEPGTTADKGEKQTETAPAVTPQEPQKSDTPPVPSGEDDLPSDVQGLRAALKAERQKRQEFGNKATDYEKQLAAERKRAEDFEQLIRGMATAQPQPAQQTKQPQQRPTPPDPLTDPEGALAYQSQLIAGELSRRDNAIYETRVVMSQELMRSAHPDYDEIEKAFLDEADRQRTAGDTSLYQRLYNHPVPARFAYEMGKQLKVMSEMGSDPDAYIQRKIAEAIAARDAAAASAPVPTVPQIPTPRAAPPQSLASVPSVAPRGKQTYTGPTPLSELYK